MKCTLPSHSPIFAPAACRLLHPNPLLASQPFQADIIGSSKRRICAAAEVTAQFRTFQKVVGPVFIAKVRHRHSRSNRSPTECSRRTHPRPRFRDGPAAQRQHARCRSQGNMRKAVGNLRWAGPHVATHDAAGPSELPTRSTLAQLELRRDTVGTFGHSDAIQIGDGQIGPIIATEPKAPAPPLRESCREYRAWYYTRRPTDKASSAA